MSTQIKKNTFGLPTYVIEQLRTLFSHEQGICRVIIYGSRAMGTYRTGSDIDLCIESKSMDLTQLLKIENQIDDLLLPWKVDLSLKNKIDNQNFLDHINTEGVVFWIRPKEA